MNTLYMAIVAVIVLLNVGTQLAKIIPISSENEKFVEINSNVELECSLTPKEGESIMWYKINGVCY